LDRFSFDAAAPDREVRGWPVYAGPAGHEVSAYQQQLIASSLPQQQHV